MQRQRFADFLSHKKMRKTAERFVVLDGALALDRRFTGEDLVDEIAANGEINVSRASVYNTLTLLVESGVVRQISLAGRRSYYERTDQEHTTHLVCNVCGKIKDVKDKPFIAFMNTSSYSAFTPERYDLCVYGTCSTCARKRHRTTQPTTAKNKRKK